MFQTTRRQVKKKNSSVRSFVAFGHDRLHAIGESFGLRIFFFILSSIPFQTWNLMLFRKWLLALGSEYLIF